MTFEQEYWRRLQFPSPDHFQRELVDLYLLASPLYDDLALPAEYLASLIKQITAFYAFEFPPELPPDPRHVKKLEGDGRAYKLILDTFLQSLIAFTRAYPYQPPQSEPLFAKPIRLIDADDSLDPALARSLLVLRQPFVEHRGVLRSAGFDVDAWSPPFYFEFSETRPQEPLTRDFLDRRRWRQEVDEWRDARRRYESQRKVTLANISELQTQLLFSPYFTFGAVLPTETPQEVFEISEDRWFEGCWIVGASGSGKTNLLRHLILRRLKEDATIIVLDSKGDLFNSFCRLEAIKDRLEIIQTSPEQPLAINPIGSKRPSEFLDHLFSVFNTGLTSQQGIPFHAIINLLGKIPGATMDTFFDIVVDGAQQYQDEIKSLNRYDQAFFNKDIKQARYGERLADIKARLYVLFGNSYLGPILTSRETRVNMSRLLDSGKVILINNNYEQLTPFGAEFLGRLFLALIWYDGRQRKSRKPVYVFVDEAHYAIANDRHVDDMVTQLRSRRISLTFAHQFLRQIDDPKVRGALDNCAIKLFNTTGEPEAAVYFPNTTADELATLEQGQFAAFVKYKTKKAEVLPIPPYRVDPETQTFIDTAQYPLISDYEYHALMLTMQARYCQRAPEPPPPDDTIYEENYINPNLADRGGIYKTKLRLDVHGRQWKPAEVTIPPKMREGFTIRFPKYGGFRRDGTRGDLKHILYRRKPDGPQTGPAELTRPSRPGKRPKSPPKRTESLDDW